MNATRMQAFLKFLSLFAKAGITVLFLCLGGLVLWSALFTPAAYDQISYESLLLVLVGIAVAAAFLLLWGKGRVYFRSKFPSCSFPETIVFRSLFVVLLFLCFLVRYVWVVENPIDPASDYYTFYHAAETLAENFSIADLEESLPRYLALFPHIFGYAFFLSVLFTLFGPSPFVAAVTNVVLSTISMALLYYIGLRLSGRFMAVAVSLLWIFYPSQILFNMFVLSEPYYTMLLLASLALLLWIRQRLSKLSFWQSVVAGIPLGILLGLANTARPIAAIILIAAAILFFVVEPLAKEPDTGKKALLFLTMCLLYSAVGTANNWLFTQRVGEAPATTPGYNIYVGFNVESDGKWNQDDSDTLVQYNQDASLSAREVQSAMLKEAVQRITSGTIDFSQLFYEKLTVLWQTDDAPIFYGKTVMEQPEKLSAQCNGFYYLTWIGSLVGAWYLFRRKGQNFTYLFPLFLLGLTMAQMLVEVATRYHYAGVPFLALLAAYGLAGLARSSEERAAKTSAWYAARHSGAESNHLGKGGLFHERGLDKAKNRD